MLIYDLYQWNIDYPKQLGKAGVQIIDFSDNQLFNVGKNQVGEQDHAESLGLGYCIVLVRMSVEDHLWEIDTHQCN